MNLRHAWPRYIVWGYRRAVVCADCLRARSVPVGVGTATHCLSDKACDDCGRES